MGYGLWHVPTQNTKLYIEKKIGRYQLVAATSSLARKRKARSFDPTFEANRFTTIARPLTLLGCWW